MKLWLVSVLILSALLLSACGGGGGANQGPQVQVNHLQASRNATSLGVPVTFSVQCTGTQGAGMNLSYQWHYGDESDPSAVTDTTSVPTAAHAYRLPPGSPVLNNYDTYQYSVTCIDKTQPTASARAPAQSIKVLREDLALSAQLCSSGAPGLGWCWQSPVPGGEGLSAVTAVSDQVAWAAGDFGTVLRTVDGGSSWLPLYLGGPAVKLPLLNSVGARDADNAWVVGVEGSFWTTGDGGASWSRGAPPTPLQLIGVVATDATHAFGISGTTVYATANAGASWRSIAVPGLGTGSQLLALAALDNQNVFVAGRTLQAFEMESADGGAHWTTPLLLQDGSAGGTNPQTLAVTRGSRCGNTDAVAIRDSVWLGGWGTGPFPGNAIIAVAYNWARGDPSAGAQHPGGVTVSAFDGRTAWLSGFSAPTILATQDALQSLASVPTPFPLEGALNAFDTPDCKTGWAVGAQGEIARTTDGARSWAAQSSKNPFAPDFHAVAARSTSTAVALAVTYDAQRIHPIYQVVGTSDGLTWQEQHADTVAYVNSAYSPFIATDAAGDIVCGSEVYLAIYANGAWSANLVSDTVPPTDPTFVSFVAASISGRSAWILEAQQRQVLLDDLSANLPYGAIPKTAIPPSNPDSIPRAIAAVDASHAVLVGDNGLIQLVSYSAGAWQWNVVASGTQARLSAVSLGGSAGAATTGWAVGQGGALLRTTDGGKTWRAQGWPVDQVFDTTLTSVSTIDGTEGWVGGTQVMMHTTDGGAHWTLTDMTVYYAIVAASGPYAAWAVGPGSFIRKTLTGGVVPPSS